MAPMAPMAPMARQLGVTRRGRAPVLPPADGLAGTPVQPTPRELPVSARLGRMLGRSADVYRLPDARSPWVGRLRQGQQVAIVSQWQGWFAIIMGDGSQAYVPQAYVEVLPYQVKSVAPAAPPVTSRADALQGKGGTISPPFSPATAPLARLVIEEALRYSGTRYVYGGNSESGIDCSGLVKNCFATCGVLLPRRVSEQADIGHPVALDQIQPGDRLYFSVKKQYDHTGIYLGSGYFIHASASRGKVAVDHLSTPLYGSTLVAARRL